jgi:hypothetical protein
VTYIRNHCVDLGQTLLLRHIRVASGDPAAQLVEAFTHAANAREKLRVYKSGYRLSVFMDHDTVFPVVDLVEHLAEVLAECDGIDFGDHGGSPIITINMVIMIDMANACQFITDYK